MKKFDLHEELLANGFVKTDAYMLGWEGITKHYEKEIEVVWYGKRKSIFDVEVFFHPDHSVVKVFYYNQSKTAFKVRMHISDKRAFNAIKATVENNGYVF